MKFHEKVGELERDLRTVRYPLEGAYMTSPGTLKLNNSVLELDDVSSKQLATFLGFSFRSLEKASDELKVTTFNYYLEEASEGSVEVQFYRGQPERFYRTDRPTLPTLEILKSLSEEVSDYDVVGWSRGYDKIVVDLVAPVTRRSFNEFETTFHSYPGVRVTLNFDTSSSSSIERLVQTYPPLRGESYGFLASFDLQKVRPKGKTVEELVSEVGEITIPLVSTSGLLDTLQYLSSLESKPVSETLPKIDVMLEGIGVAKGSQKKMSERLKEEHIWITTSDFVGELEAFLMIGLQAPTLTKSKFKAERYLGELLLRGGDTVRLCQCCTQRLPLDQLGV